MEPADALAVARPLIERIATALMLVLRESVTPIAVIRGEQTIQWGTGTFFRVADESFLVTASHVWEQAVRQHVEKDLHIFDVAGRREEGFSLRPVPFVGRIYRAPDPLDVAIVRLPQETVKELQGCRFLRLSEVSPRPRVPGRCWVFGYPLEVVQDSPENSRFVFNHLFLSAPVCEPPPALDNYDPHLHFLLDAARDDIWQPDGTPATLPHRLNGISGCSIWQTEWPKGGSADSWDPQSTRVVGVQTSYYRESSLVKATPWGVVAHILYEARPDLRPAIELNLGPG
jgi:hypothetical protein